MTAPPRQPDDPGNDSGRVRELQLKVVVLERDIFSAREALSLQAKEYERRLADLNHAHTIAQEQNATFLPREVFENTVREWSVWRLAIDARGERFLTRDIYEQSEKDLLLWRRTVDEGIAIARGGRGALIAGFSAIMALAALIVSLLGHFT